MVKIKIKNFRCYAFHGCLKEEEIIGSDYLVNMSVVSDTNHGSQNDSLKDTVNYVRMAKIIRQEMSIRSKLLETVAKRILEKVFKEFDLVKKATVSVSKVSPPIDADVKKVTVKLSQKRGDRSL